VLELVLELAHNWLWRPTAQLKMALVLRGWPRLALSSTACARLMPRARRVHTPAPAQRYKVETMPFREHELEPHLSALAVKEHFKLYMHYVDSLNNLMHHGVSDLLRAQLPLEKLVIARAAARAAAG
jgi:hypothetical protein